MPGARCGDALPSPSVTRLHARAGSDAASPWLHPVTLAALAALVINDHFAKFHAPGWCSGKVSDAAILVVGPLAVRAVLAWAMPRWRADRAMLAACALTGVVYALEKTFPWATEAYRVAWGCLRWPLDGVVAMLRGREFPAWRPVAAVTDPTDLLALPALWLAWRVHRACDVAPRALATEPKRA